MKMQMTTQSLNMTLASHNPELLKGAANAGGKIALGKNENLGKILGLGKDIRDIRALDFVKKDPRLSKRLWQTMCKRWDEKRHQKYQTELNDGDLTADVVARGRSVNNVLVDNRCFISQDTRDNAMKQKLWVETMNA